MNNTTFTNCKFIVSDFDESKKKVLNWLQQFSTFCFLDNHQYQSEHHSVECLAAAGIRREVKENAGHALESLDKFIKEKQSWIFGHLGYDLKNEIESLSSSNPDMIGFNDLYFFEPEIIVQLTRTEIIIEANDPASVYSQINNISLELRKAEKAAIQISARITREEYISTIGLLREHIQRGDCYEINFCQEFFVPATRIDALQLYQKLGKLSPNPFSALYRTGDKWLICASPERYLKKMGSRILSQPIKGTSTRVSGASEEDEYQKSVLRESEKDRSENVMVVDLVRNDLSKICKEGSVIVDELFGIYSFPQVHQMISTVSGELRDDINFSEIIRASFPMGSMTGAPKKRVMELIEKYEKTKRGLFSGALGYMQPGGDFDFNVVIRSILYNSATGYLSFPAGSGITFYSDAANEWEECLVKAAAIKKVLEGN